MNTINKIENEKNIAKEKLEIVCRGVDETMRDINNSVCCTGTFNILRG